MLAEAPAPPLQEAGNAQPFSIHGLANGHPEPPKPSANPGKLPTLRLKLRPSSADSNSKPPRPPGGTVTPSASNVSSPLLPEDSPTPAVAHPSRQADGSGHLKVKVRFGSQHRGQSTPAAHAEASTQLEHRAGDSSPPGQQPGDAQAPALKPLDDASTAPLQEAAAPHEDPINGAVPVAAGVDDSVQAPDLAEPMDSTQAQPHDDSAQPASQPRPGGGDSAPTLTSLLTDPDQGEETLPASAADQQPAGLGPMEASPAQQDESAAHAGHSASPMTDDAAEVFRSHPQVETVEELIHGSDQLDERAEAEFKGPNGIAQT